MVAVVGLSWKAPARAHDMVRAHERPAAVKEHGDAAGQHLGHGHDPVLGSIVLFRHGARTPVFRLPDAAGDIDWKSEILEAPPGHAANIRVLGGRAWRRSAATQAQGDESGRVNAGEGGGQLTKIGWAQGEALGRRLKTIYGQHAADDVEVFSTDMPRTVETAHAVLTGLMEQTDNPIDIRVELPSPWIPTTRCSQLAKMMRDGRENLRQNRPRPAADTYKAINDAFAPILDGPPSFGILGVHDDCQARRWHGKPPSPAVDVALCDCASREASREVMAALGAGGIQAWRLSAGPMCYRLARTIREWMAAEEVVTYAPRGQGRTHKLVLISAHDTSIFALLNAVSKNYRDSCVNSVHGCFWPPYASCVIFDVMKDRIDLRYQFEPLSAESEPTSTDLPAGSEDAQSFLSRLDRVALNPAQVSPCANPF